MSIDKVNLDEMLGRFTEHWSPKTVGRVNDYEIKLVKVQGRVRLAPARRHRRDVPGAAR